MKTKRKTYAKVPPDYLERLFARNPAERGLLKQRDILIAGTGSVGSAIAELGARAGLGGFKLIDREQLAAENLARHTADLTQVGLPKVEAVANRIRQINPEAQITTLCADLRTIPNEQLAPLLESRPLLIGATDSFAAQARLNLLSLAYQLPAVFIGCWGAAQTGEVLYSQPGTPPCFECYAGFRRQREAQSLDDVRRYTEPNFDESRAPSQPGLYTNILWIASFAFQVALAALGCPAQQPLLADVARRPLWIINLMDTSLGLPPFAVTPAQVQRGCAVCEPEWADILEL